jgi:broad specificity phosphatase PhoE
VKATGTTIYFIRHGNTEKGEVDKARQLTERGVQQAIERGKSLSEISFDLVISSSARRCVSTAEKIWGGMDRNISVNEMLYVPGTETADGKAIDEVFNQIGYQSYIAYTMTKAKKAIERYGIKNAAMIRGMIATLSNPPKNVLVVGHAALLQAIATEFAKDRNAFPFHISIGEACGIAVETKTGKVSLIM